MKRNKELPPPAAEPWNTPITTPAMTSDIDDTTAPVDGYDDPGALADNPAAPGPSDAPTVQMPALAYTDTPDAVVDLDEPQSTTAATPVTTQSPKRRSSFRSAAIACGALAAVLIIAAVSLVVLLGGGSDTGETPTAIAPAPPSSSAPAAPPVDPNADCPTAINGPVSTGRDAGDFASGAGVIKKYDYAFYIARSGTDARATGAPSANMGTAQAIQSAIDATPAGTKHCLSITDRSRGLFDVTLTQTPPGGGAPTIYQQQFQTTTIAGRTLIAKNLVNTKVQ